MSYKVELTQDDLNDIWRASLMLNDPNSWDPSGIRAISKRLKKLVKRIKAGIPYLVKRELREA